MAKSKKKSKAPVKAAAKTKKPVASAKAVKKSASQPAAKSAGKSPSKAAGKSAVQSAGKKSAPKLKAAVQPAANKKNKKDSSKPKGATVHSLAAAMERKKQNRRDLSNFISPLDDRVLVQIESADRMTPGGLYIPDTVSITGNFEASVLAVGRGHLDKKGRVRPLELKVGDRVLIGQYAGSVLEIDGEELKIIRESEVLGTVAK